MKFQRAGVDDPTQIQKISKTITFTGAAGAGDVGLVTVFTLSGLSYCVKCLIWCTSDLISAGGGSVSLGSTANVVGLIAATTATTIDTGEMWLTNAPGVGTIAVPSVMSNAFWGSTISIDVTVAAVTGGVLNFYLEYIPISAGATVT